MAKRSSTLASLRSATSRRPGTHWRHLEDPAQASAAGRERALVQARRLPGTHQRCFELLRDPASWRQWVPGLREVALRSEASVELRFDHLRAQLEITATEPSGRIEVELVALSLPTLAAATVVLELAPGGPTTCALELRLCWTPPARFDLPALDGVIELGLRRWIGTTLAALSRELDRQALLERRGGLVDEAQRWPPGPPTIAIPPVFSISGAGIELLHAARSHLRASARVDAPALEVDRIFTRFEHAERWLDQFLGVRWLSEQRVGPGARFEEYFSFMTLRVRTVEHEPGRRWFAVCEACSLPIAARMVEEVRFEPTADGGTIVDWHVAFDAPTLLRVGVPIIAPLFESWMQRCLDQLAGL